MGLQVRLHGLGAAPWADSGQAGELVLRVLTWSSVSDSLGFWRQGSG